MEELKVYEDKMNKAETPHIVSNGGVFVVCWLLCFHLSYYALA